MTTQAIIQAILAKRSDLTEQQILENLAEERNRSGGLLGDETLLRLIAAKFSVEVPHQKTVIDRVLPSSRLFAGLNDVTVEGRLIAIFPARSFNGGERSGKFATLMIVDCEGLLRVVLWNDKADLVENGTLKAGEIVRLVHGYTREDRYGKVELHLGGKSKIEVNTDADVVYPSLEKFATKISELTNTYRFVHLAGKVREVFNLTTFTKGDGSEGKVLRFNLVDGSGVAMVVAWNEKADELDKTLKPDVGLHLINAKVKETQSGGLEVHLDSSCFVNVLPVELLLAKIADLKEGDVVNVQGDVCSVDGPREVTTGKGERIKLLVFELQDDSGSIRVPVWRNQAEELNELKIGDEVTVENVYVKKGYGNKLELSTRNSTKIVVKPT
jgi:replication factor A1